jgi:hypothetical protein
LLYEECLKYNREVREEISQQARQMRGDPGEGALECCKIKICLRGVSGEG